ncbi:hypothetical protein [Streptomyces albireticuli]|nr:hypothetical protein [Streptomyces albireticuli]MCD9143898.1 hypothetical protein [Streptomyces albireticuli]MCD9161671.1 hypothetical protein [Streptomyces albireticuli]MCD9192015.1 hypothetical protein [Streptomyces albireticuli]
MPVVTDPDSVPLTPVYTIVISAAGEATIEGEPVDPLPGQDARTSALADIRVRAARRGHPIRINAKEPDGSVWPLIVDHDGAVTPLGAPHPVPVPPPAEPVRRVVEPERPVEAVRPVEPVRAEAPGYAEAPVPPPGPAPVAAFAPAPVAVPAPVAEPAPASIPLAEPAPAPPVSFDAYVPPAPPVTSPKPPVDWREPLPARHAPAFARIVAAELRGDLAAAAVAAKELEAAADREYGPLHPHTIGALATRAWLALLLQEDWAAATRLHLRTAERRDTARAPLAETLRTLRNARAAWQRLAAVDKLEAEDIRPELLRVSELIEGGRPQ